MPPVGFEPIVPAIARPQTYAIDSGHWDRFSKMLTLSNACTNSMPPQSLDDIQAFAAISKFSLL
jgi:hypothetical protein